jgi:hypothetical protein
LSEAWRGALRLVLGYLALWSVFTGCATPGAVTPGAVTAGGAEDAPAGETRSADAETAAPVTPPAAASSAEAPSAGVPDEPDEPAVSLPAPVAVPPPLPAPVVDLAGAPRPEAPAPEEIESGFDRLPPPEDDREEILAAALHPPEPPRRVTSESPRTSVEGADDPVRAPSSVGDDASVAAPLRAVPSPRGEGAAPGVTPIPDGTVSEAPVDAVPALKRPESDAPGPLRAVSTPPELDIPEADDAPTQSEMEVTRAQPEPEVTPSRPETATTPDQPETQVPPAQPQLEVTPDQPATQVTPGRPEIATTPTQPEPRQPEVTTTTRSVGVGDTFSVRLAGPGWLYLGEADGVEYRDRRADAEGVTFTFRLLADPEEQPLRFEAQDLGSGRTRAHTELVVPDESGVAAADPLPTPGRSSGGASGGVGQAGGTPEREGVPDGTDTPGDGDSSGVGADPVGGTTAAPSDERQLSLREADRLIADGDPAGAVAIIEEMRDAGLGNEDELLFRLAGILESEWEGRDLRRSRSIYREIVAEFPLSSFRRPAQRRIEYLDRHFFLIR